MADRTESTTLVPLLRIVRRNQSDSMFVELISDDDQLRLSSADGSRLIAETTVHEALSNHPELHLMDEGDATVIEVSGSAGLRASEIAELLVPADTDSWPEDLDELDWPDGLAWASDMTLPTGAGLPIVVIDGTRWIGVSGPGDFVFVHWSRKRDDIEFDEQWGSFVCDNTASGSYPICSSIGLVGEAVIRSDRVPEVDHVVQIVDNSAGRLVLLSDWLGDLDRIFPHSDSPGIEVDLNVQLGNN
jgi:hypothetical protein